jgi:glycosyltransferase 2 family protein
MSFARTSRLTATIGQRMIVVACLWVAASLALAIGTFWWYWVQASHDGGLASFRWPLLLPAAAFATTSFGLRTLRWHGFLAAAGAHPRFLTSLRAQLIGFSLTMTPGKVGEVYKCYLIERRTGVPTARTAPIVLFEKLMDAAAFAGLALLAAALLPELADSVNNAARSLIIAGIGFGVIVILGQALRPEMVSGLLLRWVGRSRIGRRVAAQVGLLLAGSLDVLRPKTLARAFTLGVVARTCDGLALAWGAFALGIDIPPIAGVFVLNSSGTVGGLSMLPGGIGVVEFTMSFLLATLGATPAAALAGAMTARLLTFWVWVALGLSLLVTGDELRTGSAQEAAR